MEQAWEWEAAILLWSQEFYGIMEAEEFGRGGILKGFVDIFPFL